MKVKNINLRRQNSCSCGTWLDHWAKVCGWPVPQLCAAKTCMARPQLGAHVQRDDATDPNWYIIPLCVKHSIRAASLEIVGTSTLVLAHVSETCGKQMPIGNAWPHELKAALGSNIFRAESDTAIVHWTGESKRIMPKLYSKRKPGHHEPPALTVMY
jgi:hypothetical protein